MNLNNFEDHIDKIIIARGYDYYENDYVVSVAGNEDHGYEAKVEGTELYTVKVKLDHEANITRTYCDCPYDMGEYCKHEIAVFLALRDMHHGNDSEAIIKSPVSKIRKVPNIEKILSDMTKQELVRFLLDIALEYEEIKQRIELNFNDEDDEDVMANAIELIQTSIRNNADRYGFVTYRDTDAAVKGADMVLDKARSSFAQNNNMFAVELVLCVTQEMIDLLQRADDSNGVIGGVIEESFSVISEIIDDEELTSVDKESIFGKLLEESTHIRYEGWIDWKLDLLKKCAELAYTSNLRDRLEQYLLSVIQDKEGDSWSVNYLAEKVNLIRYHMIEEYDGQSKAQEFIEQNLQYSNFRELAIEIALDNKEYDNVIKLTLEGEEKDKSWAGLIDQWKKYRYIAFQRSGKLDDQRGMAIEFILGGSMDYYSELKNTYDTTVWPSVYPKIIFLLEDEKRTFQDIYPRILIEEGEKQKLLEHVKGRPSSVEILYKHLLPEFKEEIYTVFQQHIEQTAAHAGNRKDYQRVCAIIRNLKKAGGKEQALEIIQRLYNQYANRPAFRDELSRV
ncbi:hypothetical protein J2T13_001326 [Paenibacillus sp. DS2015]|uniref:SWIM zinc finger family protein n=1 Tax=Paenibacillus sp. DS2015 TaxID=3373917 RepID=UPI003D1E39E6